MPALPPALQRRTVGLDEHFFTRQKGYATTFCDLKSHSVFDVVLGRSEAALESFLSKLPGKERVRVVCIDLSSTYRALVRKHSPNARIVADRFHVIRLVNQHFLACWRDLDPAGFRHRGLLSLMRRHRRHLPPEQKTKLREYLARHPVLPAIYFFKQRLCYLLLERTCNRKRCQRLAPRLIRPIEQLRQAGLAPLVTLGETLHSWMTEIASMWRFSRSKGRLMAFATSTTIACELGYCVRRNQLAIREVPPSSA